MFYKKVFALLLCFLLVGQGLAQTKTTTVEPKKLEISDELKEKSLNLLNALARESEQFYLAENRVTARMRVADLLWEYDEKQARAIFQNAIADLNSMIGQLPPETEDDSTERYAELNPIKELRSEILLVLAKRDPKFALDALLALNGKTGDGENLFTEDATLELGIASKITDKDPKQAYELAKKNLETNLDYSLFSTLTDIYKKDADLGARLAKDIAAKIKSKKINSPYDYMSNSNVTKTSNVTSPTEPAPLGVWQVQTFLETIKKLNRLAAKDNKTLALTENEVKELVEILAQKYLNQPYLTAYDVSKIMPEITKYFPPLAQAIRRKLSNNTGGDLDGQIRAVLLEEETGDKTADEIVQIAEKKPVAERDDFYRQAAEKAINEGNVAKAKELYAKVKKKPEYDYFGDRIESELPLSLAKSGDLRATREMLATLKTPEERIEILTNLAVSVAAKGDKKTAAALVDEARGMYAGKMKQRKNLSSVLQLGYAYSTIDTAQSFTMIESNVQFINDVVAAGILLDEFNELGAVKGDEVLLSVVESESYRNLKSGVALIKNLANADFERLGNLADRFARPEARFFARYRIAEALLNPDADANEKEMQSKADERYYDH
jgi:Flp pilus assembly protein TadD